MRILRVEQEDGTGPWEQGESLSWNAAHPTPSQDGIWKWNADFKCAMKDIDQLIHWFGECWTNLTYNRKYYVVEIEVPDNLVECGKTQVVFPKDAGKRISRIPIQELFS